MSTIRIPKKRAERKTRQHDFGHGADNESRSRPTPAPVLLSAGDSWYLTSPREKPTLTTRQFGGQDAHNGRQESFVSHKKRLGVHEEAVAGHKRPAKHYKELQKA